MTISPRDLTRHDRQIIDLLVDEAMAVKDVHDDGTATKTLFFVEGTLAEAYWDLANDFVRCPANRHKEERLNAMADELMYRVGVE